ncbi:MAG TPA: VOC family protein [Methylomirabilota bacterium]|jgi:glyoxylase I family protein|nr:VOC family protein [Methylomirabilota bacterium]
MQASVYHVQLNVADAAVSLPFYRALLGYLEYRVMIDGADLLGMSNGTTDFWIVQTDGRHTGRRFHRKAPGLNHVAFRVTGRDDVDRFATEFLAARGIVALYGGPREYPEYRPGYYAVFFEDPDRLKLEVLHFPVAGGTA